MTAATTKLDALELYRRAVALEAELGAFIEARPDSPHIHIWREMRQTARSLVELAQQAVEVAGD